MLTVLLLATGAVASVGEDWDDVLRERMVAEQLASSPDGRTPIVKPRVLEAMRTVPRHAFVPSVFQNVAYADQPLPIGEGRTLSWPYLVALVTELADIRPRDRVLEIGTGWGYQAAIFTKTRKGLVRKDVVPVQAAPISMEVWQRPGSSGAR